MKIGRQIVQELHYPPNDSFKLPKYTDMTTIKIPRRFMDVQITGPDDQELIFETDLVETLGIRKFIEMSLADLNDQVTKASKDRAMSPKQFDLIKLNAMIVTAWLTSALQTVDGMLAEAKARSSESLAEQKKAYTGC